MMQTTNAGKSLAILMAMPMRYMMRGASPNSAHQGLHLKPLDAAIK
jgi:hypothetical protein